jgi:hypothetical protein
MDQIIRESTYIMSDRSVCGDKKKSCLVFFGAFFSGAGAGFSLFTSMKTDSADTCVNLRQQQQQTRSTGGLVLPSTQETNSMSSRPSGGVNSGVF